MRSSCWNLKKISKLLIGMIQHGHHELSQFSRLSVRFSQRLKLTTQSWTVKWSRGASEVKVLRAWHTWQVWGWAVFSARGTDTQGRGSPVPRSTTSGFPIAMTPACCQWKRTWLSGSTPSWVRCVIRKQTIPTGEAGFSDVGASPQEFWATCRLRSFILKSRWRHLNWLIIHNPWNTRPWRTRALTGTERLSQLDRKAKHNRSKHVTTCWLVWLVHVKRLCGQMVLRKGPNVTF